MEIRTPGCLCDCAGSPAPTHPECCAFYSFPETLHATVTVASGIIPCLDGKTAVLTYNPTYSHPDSPFAGCGFTGTIDCGDGHQVNIYLFINSGFDGSECNISIDLECDDVPGGDVSNYITSGTPFSTSFTPLDIEFSFLGVGPFGFNCIGGAGFAINISVTE